jgi:hypothetical protein
MKDEQFALQLLAAALCLLFAKPRYAQCLDLEVRLFDHEVALYVYKLWAGVKHATILCVLVIGAVVRA